MHSGMEMITQYVNEERFVSDIVRNDFRTADIFRKYGINYCCGGKWPLQVLCDNRGLDTKLVVEELNQCIQHSRWQHGILRYEKWSMSFQVDFLINVQHAWILNAFAILNEVVSDFVGKHTKKFPELVELPPVLVQFEKSFRKSIEQDEQSFFPYIKKLERSFLDNASYATMFVKTLGKPLAEQMKNESARIRYYLQEVRRISNNYQLPEAPCTSHLVAFYKLKEMDFALLQMQALKYEHLYTNAIEIEKLVLKDNG